MNIKEPLKEQRYVAPECDALALNVEACIATSIPEIPYGDEIV